MPRNDDVRRNLHWMEEELLAEEEEYEEEYETDDLMARVDRLLEEEEAVPVPRTRRRKNPAVDFSRTVYADEEFDENSAVFVEEPKKKGIGGLVVLAILETIGILAIAGWWLQWL